MDQLLRMILTELSGAWRFRWYAIGVAWVVALGGILYVLTMPDIYEARAEVYVDTNDPLLATQRGGGADAQLKVDYVRRLLLSTPNLEQVARETDLDLRAPTPQAFIALVQELQRSISVEPGRAGRGFDANLYQIVYQDYDRRIAERVVQVLLNSFQEQSLEGDLRDDLHALSFLDNQMTDYRQRLEEAEARVADFRRRNAGLVGAEGGFFTRLDSLQEQLREVRADLRIALEKRAALAAQFETSGSGSSRREAGATSLAELETQVSETEKRLDELRLIYTDEHPSVTATQETLEALRRRLEQRRDELGPLLATGSGAVVENVRISLTQAEVQVTELRGRERDLVQRIDELQQKVDIAPQLEAELAGLNRDHTVLRNHYESLLERRELLSFEIDRKRQGRQLEFRIIEPPRAPQVPVAPDRFRLLLLVLGASLGIGGGVAYLLHQLRPVFITGETVYQQLGIPVLGAVSMIWTRHATWRRHGEQAALALGLVLLVGVFGMVFTAMPTVTAIVQRLLG